MQCLAKPLYLGTICNMKVCESVLNLQDHYMVFQNTELCDMK